MNTRQAAPFVTLVLAVAAMFIITWGIRSSAAILNPILLASVITVSVLPLPEKLAKRGLPAWLSFTLTLLAVVAVIVLLGYVLINGSVQNFIQPRMMGTGLGISPVVVFISLFVWGWLLGGVGAILAVPLTMIIMSVLASFENTRWIATLMAVTPGQKGDQKHNEAGEKLRQSWQDVKHIFGGDQSGETT